MSSRLALTAVLSCALAATPVALAPLAPLAPPVEPATVSPAPASPARAAAPPRCRDLAAALTRREQVGQLLMLGVSSTSLSRADARILADVRPGAVVLLGNSTAGTTRVRALTRSLGTASRQPDRVRLLVAADQEGGLVQRLQGPGFSRMPAARVQATWSDKRLRAQAATWGRQLSRAGIDVDLAPVADVVPVAYRRSNAPIGQLRRDYGPRPSVVGRKTSAFVRGMDSAGVGTAVKHFPGLGRVRGNTDVTAHVVDTVTTRHDSTLRGFRESVRSGVDMVMVSSAYYARIDKDRRAAFSPVVIGQMIRHDLDFDKVVISDDLSARAMRDLTPGQRAVRFLRAGGDVAIVGNPRDAGRTVTGVLAEAKADPAFARDLQTKVARVLRLKAARERGPSCG